MNSKTVLKVGTLVLCCVVLALFSGCGSFQAIPQNVVVTVSPTTASVVLNQSQQFTATVQNDPLNRGVNWVVSNLEFANCTPVLCGTIDQTGKYTAPSSIPTNPGFTTIQIGAFSASNSTEGGFASITLLPPQTVAVQISPTTAAVQVGQSLQFTATVQNDPANKGVTWSIGTPPPSNSCPPVACGTIDQSGKYTAPAAVSNNPDLARIPVGAASIADPSKFSDWSLVTITAGASTCQ